MPILKTVIVLGLVFVVSACSTRRETSPPRTATEQLLISAAADRAADRIKLDIPKNAKVFVDAANIEGLDSKYAIAALRERMLKLGASLVADRGAADVVVEIRSGALSMDEEKILVGIPSFDIPIPTTGAITFPEIALFKKAERKGVAKFAGIAYDAKNGTFSDISEPQYGFSRDTRWSLLLFISWETGDYLPEENRDPRFDVDAISPFEEDED